MLVLATAIVALACEKGAPPSNGTASLSKNAGSPLNGTANAAPATAATTATQAAPSGVQRTPVPPNAVSPQPSASDEGDGEPMDDVDDDEVSATDKSGAGAVTNEGADEAASGPVDDSEGVDIDIR
jgi:hypothetical protein